MADKKKQDDATPPADAKEVTITAEQFNDLMNRLNAAENAVKQATSVQQQGAQPHINAAGQVAGEIWHGEKDMNKFENPADKLREEEALAKYMFDYDFDFEIKIKEWKKDNMTHKAPRFRLYVWRNVYDDPDEDGNEKLLGYALVQKSDFKEYDYDRFKRWALSVFRPQAVKPKKQNQEVVIDGKLVEFKETENITDIDYGRGRPQR